MRPAKFPFGKGRSEVIDSVKAFEKLPDILLIAPKRFGDARGYFSESWSLRGLEQAQVDLPPFVQDNHSVSYKKGTVRGLHYQAPPHAQGKLVRCGRGSIYDVAVDVRAGSPTYGTWVGEELSADNGKQLWIPAGFLHGFMSLEENSEILYKCTDYYDSECDGSVLWSSAGIQWPLEDKVILSEKDEAAIPLADFDTPFHYAG